MSEALEDSSGLLVCLECNALSLSLSLSTENVAFSTKFGYDRSEK